MSPSIPSWVYLSVSLFGRSFVSIVCLNHLWSDFVSSVFTWLARFSFSHLFLYFVLMVLIFSSLECKQICFNEYMSFPLFLKITEAPPLILNSVKPKAKNIQFPTSAYKYPCYPVWFYELSKHFCFFTCLLLKRAVDPFNNVPLCFT